MKVKLYSNQYLEECLLGKHSEDGFTPKEVLIHCDMPEKIIRKNFDYMTKNLPIL